MSQSLAPRDTAHLTQGEKRKRSPSGYPPRSPSPLRPARKKCRRPEKKKPKANDTRNDEAQDGSDVEPLERSRDLGFWKNKEFHAANMHNEEALAQHTALTYDRSKIMVMYPKRYSNVKTDAKKFTTYHHVVNLEENTNAVVAVRDAYLQHTPAGRDVKRLVFWVDGSSKDNGKMSADGTSKVVGHNGFSLCWRIATATAWGVWDYAGYKAIGICRGSGEMGTYVSMNYAHSNSHCCRVAGHHLRT
jgi:FtsZ-interacting cell division protein YlmF